MNATIRNVPLSLLALAGAAAAQERWLVRADTVYTAAGDAIQGGHVAVADGKIVSVGPGGGSGGDRLDVAAVTPGMIDLSVRIDTGNYSVEQADETPIELSVEDGLDLYAYQWDRALRSGVTTALATPADRAVIGGMGIVLKTGGEPTLEARLVERDAVLRGAVGSEPSSGNRPPRGTTPRTFYYRRPTTRMGVEWVWRKSYYDALAAAESGEALTPRQKVRNERLLQTLRGDLPLFVQAWATQDIRTTVYLKEELGIQNVVIDAAAEAWREPQLLVRSGVGVVLPPYPASGRSNDGAFYAMDTAAKLHELGVPIALSAHNAADVGERLDRQAGFAIRGGLPFDAALAAVTIQPARMAGVDDRVGSLAPGKDADLVLWSGKPFEPTSRVVGVILDGQLVVDPRQ